MLFYHSDLWLWSAFGKNNKKSRKTNPHRIKAKLLYLKDDDYKNHFIFSFSDCEQIRFPTLPLNEPVHKSFEKKTNTSNDRKTSVGKHS